tara:strand:- start:6684 stop:7460 length:777 start_codon:yes stop_codon:yes gene_type:complete
MKLLSKIILIILLVFTSCKTNRKVAEGNNIKAISTKKIISNHYNSDFNHETISARINADYKDNKTTVSFSIKLRLEKDKTIWMSATKFGFPVAKVKITPTRVSYYEKIQRTFFDGDFSLLSKWLGTELDYEKVQNILLGQAVLNLRNGRYDSKIDNNLYELKPKKDNDLFGILFFMNPENFKLNKQEIRNQEKEQLLTVSYPNYIKIKGEQFPENINIRAIDHKNFTTINMEYKGVEFNQNLTFPFEIPIGYKEISLK